MTDALIMGGNGTGDYVAETIQAFKVGADLLLWPPVEAAEEIEKQILNGEIPMSRLEDALNRIEKMETFRNEALKNKSYDTPDAKFVDETKLEIAKNGMCLLRNEMGLLPLSEETCRKVLIVDITDEDPNSSRLLKEELEKRGIKADVCRDIDEKYSQVCWPLEMKELSKGYDIVICNVNAFFASQWGETHMLIWASHQFPKQKKIIVNYASPYFAKLYFPEDRTYIEMNTTPSAETIKMLVDGLFGKLEMTGKSVLTKEDDHVSVS